MSKEKGKTQNKKRKLTRQEKKQIDALIRQSKGDGKPHTAQDSIPFERMYKDGICRLANGRYSKCIEFEDINYQLAQPDDKTAIFEALCGGQQPGEILPRLRGKDTPQTESPKREKQAFTDKNNYIASTANEYPFARNARASHRERGHFACWDSPKPLYDRERT